MHAAEYLAPYRSQLVVRFRDRRGPRPACPVPSSGTAQRDLQRIDSSGERERQLVPARSSTPVRKSSPTSNVSLMVKNSGTVCFRSFRSASLPFLQRVRQRRREVVVFRMHLGCHEELPDVGSRALILLGRGTMRGDEQQHAREGNDGHCHGKEGARTPQNVHGTHCCRPMGGVRPNDWRISGEGAAATASAPSAAACVG